ncbi:MAG: response regulator, partial [Pseudomonadota bacterium]
MKVLIVDDDIVIRMTLQKPLESIAECTAVENAEDALKIALSDNPPDLILLDILMPGINGFEVCSRLKASAQTKDIPVIFLSANSDVEDKTRGIELGAVDYITKPFHMAEVKARVQTHLALKKMRADLREKDLQLIEMDRMAGIGTLASGIAHEINNPAMFILSNVAMLEQNWPVIREILESTRSRAPDEEIDFILEEMPKVSAGVKNGVERIRKIVNSLRDFSKQDIKSVGMVDINKTIAEVIEFIKSPAESASLDIITELK